MNHRDLVRLVRKRLNGLGMTPYQLHRMLVDKVSKQTIYNFVEHGRVIKSDTLLIIMRAVGLAIINQPKKHHEK